MSSNELLPSLRALSSLPLNTARCFQQLALVPGLRCCQGGAGMGWKVGTLPGAPAPESQNGRGWKGPL